ncbi:MAG: SDR family NAD(P)-dependent oxidoreductase [Pseudomonadota bacterium]
MTNSSSSGSAPWKHVWLTGASSGLGEHTARILAEQGCHVSISARSKDKLDAIAASHANISAHPADVTDAARLKEVVAEIEAEYGPVDLCIFSAGAWFQSKITELNLDNFSKTVDVNLMGVVNSIDAVLPQMLERGRGHISWVSSVAGYSGLPGAASYGATKAALINLAETVKPELEARNIDVSVINPGFVRTPMTDKNDFPMPFLMEPEDAAAKIVEGLKARRFEVAFPWQLVRILKTMRILPYWLYFKITRRMLRSD